MPVKSFWESENKIPIGQTSVIVESENNLDHSAGQKVTFHIPPGIEFFNPKETYLKLDCLISVNASATTKLQLDTDIGGNVLITDLRVKTLNGQVLEEIQGYNTLVTLMYDYETNDNFRKKRALTEGASYDDPALRPNGGGYTTHQNNVRNNPYVSIVNDSKVSAPRTDLFKTAKLLLPLAGSGIFQNDKVFPNMLTDGLVLELVLSENNVVFRQMDNALESRNLYSNPQFLNVGGGDDTGSASSGSELSVFFCDPVLNGGNDLETFPFEVGETFNLVNKVDYAVTNRGVVTATRAGVGAGWRISELEMTTGSGSDVKVKVTTEPGVNLTKDINGDFVMVSTATHSSNAFKPSYTLSNLELVIQKLEMPDGYKSSLMSSMKSGGKMVYDFMSYTNYRFSTLASETLINLRLPLQNSRAKAIWCIPTSAQTQSISDRVSATGTYFQTQDAIQGGGCSLFSDKTGLEGCVDFLQKYQFLYDNKLQPNRKVDVSKTGNKASISQEGLVELEKALAMGGVEPRSFRKWNRNFVVGRALSLGDGVYDTRGKDFNLQLEYTGSGDTAPQINKLWNCFCAHIRGLQISGENTTVVL